MTQEAHGHSPEESTAPPASTRWSEDPVEDHDALAAPFVPGRSRGGPAGGAEAAGTETAGAAPEAGPEPERDPVPETPSPRDTPGELDEEPFPFDVMEEPEPEAEADDFPVEAFDIEGTGAAGAEAAPVEEEVEWTPADLDFEEPAELDPDAGMGAEPAPDAAVTREPASPEVTAPDTPDAAGEVAVLLERMAGMLREEGVEAVRREMDAPDRLTSLLAGLVAGYVSGRS